MQSVRYSDAISESARLPRTSPDLLHFPDFTKQGPVTKARGRQRSRSSSTSSGTLADRSHIDQMNYEDN
jgi:hypothetical protein